MFVKLIRLIMISNILFSSYGNGFAGELSDSVAQWGARCTSSPCTYDKRGMNVCQCFKDEIYRGITSIFAKKLAQKKCQQLNALDYGHQFGKGCYGQCKVSTMCFPWADA